jgi:DNA-binding response OmpR family regulator
MLPIQLQRGRPDLRTCESLESSGWSFTIAAYGARIGRTGDCRVRPFQGSCRTVANLSPTAGVRLGGRIFDVLTALIDASGAVISKNELISRVWQGRIVE